MNKVPATALAFAISISSAAAEPIKMTDGELELIHGGENNPFSVQITSIYPDGSAVVIQDGAEYRIAPGSTLSLPDGTQIQITQNSNGYALLVTNGTNISVSGGSANGSITKKMLAAFYGTGR